MGNTVISQIENSRRLWHLFTCRQEYDKREVEEHVDRYGRFLYGDGGYHDPLHPEVSAYLSDNGLRFPWPDDSSFAVCLTHDIDSVYPTLKYRGFTALKLGIRGDFKRAVRRVFRQENPYWNFRDVVALERKYDATSTFFVITASRDIHGFRYDPWDIEDELAYVLEHGGDVGLHGGFYSYDSLDSIVEEKQKLEAIIGRPVRGYRSHYMRFTTPQTWRILQKAGFCYDATFGYPDMVGFRNGTCHPVYPYDRWRDDFIPVVEIPLAVMDGTLMQYMGLDAEEGWRVCKEIIDTVKAYRGVLTVLWHNTTFDSIYCPGWDTVYEKMLQYCQGQDAWLTDASSLAAWCTGKDGRVIGDEKVST